MKSKFTIPYKLQFMSGILLKVGHLWLCTKGVSFIESSLWAMSVRKQQSQVYSGKLYKLCTRHKMHAVRVIVLWRVLNKQGMMLTFCAALHQCQPASHRSGCHLQSVSILSLPLHSQICRPGSIKYIHSDKRCGMASSIRYVSIMSAQYDLMSFIWHAVLVAIITFKSVLNCKVLLTTQSGSLILQFNSRFMCKLV